jgi:GMP synthase-like glutamine amidotransferase
LLKEQLINKGWELDIRCMDIPGTVLPNNLDDYHAFIILGGPMGAYEEGRYPYLLKVQALVREAASNHLPTVGICLGGQLIARALGADVGLNPIKEIGWAPVHVLPEGKANRLFSDLPSAFSVFQWHGDTFSLPEGAVLLASGEVCTNQAFVFGKNIWALQFHLEVTPTMVESWSEIYKDELIHFGGPGAADRLVRNTEARWEGMRIWREQFLNNLAAILQS